MSKIVRLTKKSEEYLKTITEACEKINDEHPIMGVPGEAKIIETALEMAVEYLYKPL